MTDPGTRSFLTLLVLAMTAVLSPVSMDMLTPSLPDLSDNLGASPQTIELTLYSFLIGYGLAPSLWGFLSDRVGRRPVMFAGMAIYSISSLAGAFVDDTGALISLRFVQGVGGAAGATIARAVIRDLYGGSGTTHGMVRMMSLMAVVPFFMPLLGGVLADTLGWQACFIAMCLIGSLSVLAYFFLVPESRPEKPTSDRPEHSALRHVLGNRIFAQHALCNMFCISILVIFGANFAFVTEKQFDFDSGTNGLVLALFNGAIAIGIYLAGKLLPRWRAHALILTGAAGTACAWAMVAALASRNAASPVNLTPLLLLAGTGCGIIMALCSGAALTPFTHHSGTASSIYLVLQSIGSSGISLLAGLLLPKALLPMALAAAACACLAITCKLLLYDGDATPGIARQN